MMHFIEIGFTFLLAMLILLILLQIGATGWNAIVGVGLMQMITLMTMMAIWMFIEEQKQLNFANLI